MRDIIWTVIILWVVWKIYDAFKLVSKATQKQSFNSQNPNDKPDNTKPKISKADVKKILQSLQVLK